MASRSLLEVLTDQIVSGKMTVEEARDIVLRHKYFQVPKRSGGSEAETKEQRQHDDAVAAMEHNDGNPGYAALELDVSRATLYRRLAAVA